MMYKTYKNQILNFIYLLLYTMFITNPNYDEFVFIIARQTFQFVKHEPEIERAYRLSSKMKKLSFEDTASASIAHEIRAGIAQEVFLIYNCWFFSFAKFDKEQADSEHKKNAYFITILKFNFTNFDIGLAQDESKEDLKDLENKILKKNPKQKPDIDMDVDMDVNMPIDMGLPKDEKTTD